MLRICQWVKITLYGINKNLIDSIFLWWHYKTHSWKLKKYQFYFLTLTALFYRNYLRRYDHFLITLWSTCSCSCEFLSNLSGKKNHVISKSSCNDHHGWKSHLAFIHYAVFARNCCTPVAYNYFPRQGASHYYTLRAFLTCHDATLYYLTMRIIDDNVRVSS